MSETRRTIRFEDLGEPVQKLLRSLKGGLTEEDMALLEYVSVKDMAKIYGEMSSDREVEQIWEELRGALQQRREKAERKRRELEKRQKEIENEQEEEGVKALREEQERLAAQEAEEAERRRRKEERRRRKDEQKQAEEAAVIAEQEAREEEERLAAEEAERKKQDAKKKKREARARELAEEQEALKAEKAKNTKPKDQKREWADYVAQHPLEFAAHTQEIEQVKIEHVTKAPPQATVDLLNRTYTPKCPNCQAKFSKAPPEWDCPMCLRRLRQRIKVWQPDDECTSCMVCKSGVGRFSRHHCRSCGRVVCSKCSEGKALIPSVGYKETPVKVCLDCVTQMQAAAPPVTSSTTESH